MSLAHKAARGAIWTVLSSMGGRAVGVLGTLVMTRFLAPEAIGEVADATILAMTANWITIWGFGQYSVVKGRGDATREVRWHATMMYVVLGVLSLGAIALLGGRLMPMFDAPNAAKYVPGMALALFIRRLGAMPERVLTQNMNFRASGLSLALGEITYTLVALVLAYVGFGGMAIVYANIVQSIAMTAILISAAGVSSWAAPTKLSWARVKDMLGFGVPLGIQGIAHQASRYWDKLTISHFFGTAAVGTYNMAYNLADIPAIQVGEQIALVLMPSLAELPRERRPAALVRSAALLSLIIFPLAVGLGLVAQPLISLLLPNNTWQEVAPLLAVLTVLSVFRPITWVLSAYMEAECKTNRLMILEVLKIGVLIGGIAVLAPLGLRAAAGAVGIAFGITAVLSILVVIREGVSARGLASGFIRPLVACMLMAAAVLGVNELLFVAGLDHPAVRLVVELLVGAGVYIAAVFVVARQTAVDLISLAKNAMRRKK
ncbi:MAG TPA: oligosaccharide flippase family protein [Kofleriaceae bacterium]|jgi:PST family polysaccharide transporter